MSRKPISKGLRFDVFNRDGFRCRYCGITSEYAQMHVDHKTPVALGGTNAFDNLVTACAACNLGKRTKLADLERDINWEGVDCPFADGWPNDIEEPVLYLNKLWAVTWFGMERIDKFYAVEAESLGSHHASDRRLGNWLHHLSTKTWVFPDIDVTIAAYLRALQVHESKVDFDMEYTLKRVREQAGEIKLLDECQRRAFKPLPTFEHWDDEI